MESILISNEDIIKKERTEGLAACCKWIKTLTDTNIKERSISSISNVIKKIRYLQKSVSRPGMDEKITQFKKEVYKFPKPLGYSRKTTTTCDPVINTSNNETLKNVMMDLADKLNTSVDKSNNLEVENKTLKQVLGKKSTLKTKLKFVRHEVCVLKKQNKFLSSKIKTKDGLIKRLRGQVAYTTCTSQKYPRQISDLSTENRNLILRIRDLENSY